MEILFDSHAHLDFPDFDEDREEMLARARAAGVKYIVTIGAGGGLECSERAVAIAETHENIWATVGVHPHDVKLMSDQDLVRLRRLAAHPKVVAIGEIGLDFYKNYSPREVQSQRFRDQLALARELEFPVVIHDREAHAEFMDILKRDGVSPAGGIVHCFSGTVELALELVKMGFYISFPGVITFRNPKALPEVAAAVPEDRILIETDCPFLTPAPHQGKRNEPAHVRLVAEAIARIRKTTLAAVGQFSTNNAFRIFQIHA